MSQIVDIIVTLVIGTELSSLYILRNVGRLTSSACSVCSLNCLKISRLVQFSLISSPFTALMIRCSIWATVWKPSWLKRAFMDDCMMSMPSKYCSFKVSHCQGAKEKCPQWPKVIWLSPIMPSQQKCPLFVNKSALSVQESTLSVKKKCRFRPKSALSVQKKCPFSTLLRALLKTGPACPSDLPVPMSMKAPKWILLISIIIVEGKNQTIGHIWICNTNDIFITNDK